MKVGDYVQVKNWGREYTTYTDWFIVNKIDPIYMIRYAYGDNTNYQKYKTESDDRIFKVLYVDDLSGVALITLSGELNTSRIKMENLDRLRQVYLIDIRALKEIHIMTKEEIEKELGYSFLFVNKKVGDKNES